MIADRITDLILPPDPFDAKIKAVFFGLQKGALDRSLLAPNLDDYFTPTTVGDFAASLGRSARPTCFSVGARRTGAE